MNPGRLRCDICGGNAVIIHKGVRDDPEINVYECEKCHTKLLDTIRDNDYEGGFMNKDRIFSREDILNRIESYKEDNESRLSLIAEHIKDKDILDFGCGFGGFIRLASKTARSVSGVEQGRTERDFLISEGIEVRDSIDTYGKFDVITMFHVFEHLKDPAKWLDKMVEHLREQGMLFIEVPNGNDALLSLYQNERFADFTYWSAHLYLYTKESLRGVIEENGKLVIESEGQRQRYSIANHLYWLAKGKPGGQKVWNMFDSDMLRSEYTKVLEKNDMCDTLFFKIRKI